MDEVEYSRNRAPHAAIEMIEILSISVGLMEIEHL